MEMGIKKTESLILWDETSQHQHQQNNSEPPGGENESPISDPCVSGGEQTDQPEHDHDHEQQNCSTDEKVELLFDSGYQVSTSSIDLSPDFMKDWLQEEKSEYLSKSETEHLKQSRSDKPYQVNSSDSLKPRDLKSEGQIKINIKKANKNEERVPNIVPPPQHQQIQQPQIPAPEPEQEIVENGDLANNNRDREGNNYQAAVENLILDDNAIPRAENLDEDNENHIVLDEPVNEPNVLVVEQIGDFQEDDDVNESVDEASREVQFDQNSELSFSDESLVIHGVSMPFESYNIVVHTNIGRQSVPASFENADTPIESQDTFQTAAGFPIWLLQMLNMSTDDPLGLMGEDAHFFSQGDGLGIHPSTININDDDSTSSSERSGNSEGGIAIAATPSHPNSTTATLTSDIDMSFYDALESGHVTHVLLDVNDVTPGERIMYPRMQNNFAQTEPPEMVEEVQPEDEDNTR